MAMNKGAQNSFPGLWQSIGLVLTLFGADLLISMLLARFGLVASESRLDAAIAGTVLSNALVLGIWFKRRGLRLGGVLHPSPYSPTVIVGLLALPILLLGPMAFLAGGAINDVLLAMAPMPEWQKRMFEALFDGSIASFLLLVVIAPFVEELVFRGIILRGLLARMPPGRALIVSSLIFGAAHMNLYQFVGAGMLGIALGWLYIRFGSTLPGMLLHATQNALTFGAVTWLGIEATVDDIPAVALIAAAIAFIPGMLILRRVLGAARVTRDAGTSRA
jgi:membrane protease YdiL (CAAX protease family)